MIQVQFTAIAKFGTWPQAKLHTQWPGTGLIGDPVFDALYASQVQFQTDRDEAEATNAHAYTKLLEHVGKSYLLVHSQAGAFGWLVGDRRPDLVKGIVALEPTGPPFIDYFSVPGEVIGRDFGITQLGIAYDPSAGPNGTELKTVTRPAKDDEHDECILQAEPAKQLKNLSKIPQLVMTGEASSHRPYEYCTVDYLRQAGVEVEFVQLGAEGIKGNGHMMFMEKNNIVVARRVLKWLEAH
jgi:pimeloyl-ACP methyl ester carboxylesterase